MPIERIISKMHGRHGQSLPSPLQLGYCVTIVYKTYQQKTIFDKLMSNFEASISRRGLQLRQETIKMTMEVSAVSVGRHFPGKASAAIQFVKKPSTLWSATP